MEVNNLSAIFRVISFFFFHYKFDCMLCVVSCFIFYFLSSFFVGSYMVVLLLHARSIHSLSICCNFARLAVCACVYMCARDDDDDIVYVTVMCTRECLGIVVLCRHSHHLLMRERERARPYTHAKKSHLCFCCCCYCYCCDAGYLYVIV